MGSTGTSRSNSGYDQDEAEDYRLPWGQNDTAQDKGRKAEKRILKKFGARAHPGSGSGKIAFDGSTDDEIIECKTAERVHSLNVAYIDRLYKTAVRMGKSARMVVQFPNYTLNITITRR